MPDAENGEVVEEQESVPGVGRPDTIRVNVEMPPAVAVAVGSTVILRGSGGAVSSGRARLTVTSSTGVTDEVEAELSRPIDPEYDNEYRLRVTGGPGDWLEAALQHEDGKPILHTLHKSGVTTEWAAVEVVGEIAEALFRQIEGLPE